VINDEKAYLYWLHQVPGVGNEKMQRLVEFFGSARDVYEATEKRLLSILRKGEVDAIQNIKRKWRVSEAYHEMTQKGVRLIDIKDTQYPQRLKQTNKPPFLLYVIGRLPEEHIPTVAIIGARECSGYGVVMAQAFAVRLAQAGVNVISGMARGIDGVSQEAAVAAGGSTFAVLGCGVDVCYPASNRKLYEAIRYNGGIISPYAPGTRPRKTLFPYRNQIVAGLADALLVVEARQKSGTWITVDRALEQGKDVYAVPGRLTDRLSDGCNLLISQGAGIALSPEDLLSELRVLQNRQKNKQNEGKKSMEIDLVQEQGPEKYLDFYPKHVDDILELVQKEDEDMTLSQLMFELIQLCVQGKAMQVGGNYFVKEK